MSLVYLDVYLDGLDEPQTVQVLSADLMVYDDINVKGRQSQAGMMLTLAYISITGSEPKTLAEVKAWGREHKVAVVARDGLPDPTQRGRTLDS